VKQTEPSRGCYNEQLVIPSRWFSTNRLRLWVRWSERMLGAQSSGIPQACRAAEAVVLVDVLGLAACWP
jgi:hypothetical protein